MLLLALALVSLHVAASSVSAAAAAALPPRLGQLPAAWVDYHRGLFHPTDPLDWRPPRHGVALPTSNSLHGSVIADENVLAVRDITMPPFTSGPWSSVARNTSRLCRLMLGSRDQHKREALPPVYTQRFRWTSYGFERVGDAAGRAVSTTVRTPLRQPGVLMQVNVSGAAAAGAAHIDFFAQVREWRADQIDCTERQWRFPSNMDSAPCTDGPGYCVRNCWNWYAPRPFENESDAFLGASHEPPERPVEFTRVFTYTDSRSNAVTAIAVQSPRKGVLLGGANSSVLAWDLSAGQDHLQVNIAIAFGVDLKVVTATALGWATDMDGALQQALDDRQERFDAVFGVHSAAGRGAAAAADGVVSSYSYYSGSLPILVTEDSELHAVYYSGVTSMLELERTTATLPHAPPNTTHLYITGAGSNASTNAFFWDQSYCATVLSMLNPTMMRSSLLQWMRPELGGRDAAAGWCGKTHARQICLFRTVFVNETDSSLTCSLLYRFCQGGGLLLRAGCRQSLRGE